LTLISSGLIRDDPLYPRHPRSINLNVLPARRP
jgi:hypothetical protein